ncbi:MAG TPA: sulfotransferase domain-containing protein [Bacteroidia bacterium]|jgi:hypothetical protein|nr:sulfotransferase domain-containing protein [Bacteroidia bacterium]
MIIISGGFPKSASTLLFYYMEEYLARSGKKNAQKKFLRWNPEGFIPAFGILNSTRLVLLSVFSGDVVVKTHAAPNWVLKLLINLKFAKAYYSIRDPRDCVLSALDHGRSAREKKEKTPSDIAFAPFQTRKDLYPAFHMHFDRYMKWKRYGKVLFVRYEELLDDTYGELNSILSYLGKTEEQKNTRAIEKYFAAKKHETRHFNKGVISRYADELKNEEIDEIEKELPEIFSEMNYPLHQNKKG